MNREINNKLEKLQNIYRSNGAKGILINKQKNISWLLRGRSHVGFFSEDGVCSLLLNENGLHLLVNNIESRRLPSEEFPEETLVIIEYPWYKEDTRLKLAGELTGENYITDGQVEDLLKPLRLKFSPGEIEDYRYLGQDAGAVLEEVCFSVKPGMTEFAIASLLAQKSVERGLEPNVILTAADERIYLYRHPLPTNRVVEKYVMLVLVARKHGLMVSLTRFVSFTALPGELKKKQFHLSKINTELISHTRPGKTTGEVFVFLRQKYAEAGYPDEWKLHHQGGIIGYSPREYKITSQIDIQIEAGNAYAWNPSITGFKAEDTYLIRENNNELLTLTPNLPSVEMKENNQKVKTAGILVRTIY